MRRHSIGKTALFLFVGAVIGTIAGELLARQLPIFSEHTQVQWNPNFDLSFLVFSLHMMIRVNWMTLVGVILAWFIHRRLK